MTESFPTWSVLCLKRRLNMPQTCLIWSARLPLDYSLDLDKSRACQAVTRKAAGFSLTELLVVLAIVGLLASLLLPVLSRLKARAKSTACQHNLKQLGLALHMYVDDWHSYPYAKRWAQLTESRPWLKTWYECLYPYTGVDWLSPLFRCPAYRGLTEPLLLGPGPHGGYRGELGSYGYNAFGASDVAKDNITSTPLGLSPFTADLRSPIVESEVRVPSDMFALGDANLSWFQRLLFGKGNEWHIAGWGAIYPSIWDGIPVVSAPRGPYYHFGQRNLAFCDGHIESIKLAKLNEPTPEARRRWNNDHEPHPDRW